VTHPHQFFDGQYCCKTVRNERPECDHPENGDEDPSRCCGKYDFVACPENSQCKYLPNSCKRTS
jgi:hypothetical protein